MMGISLAALQYLVAADEAIRADRSGKHDQAMNRIAALDMAARAIEFAPGLIERVYIGEKKEFS